MFRLFRRKAVIATAACAHASALPRWDEVQDSGCMDRVSRLYCPGCDWFIDATEARLARIADVGREPEPARVPSAAPALKPR